MTRPQPDTQFMPGTDALARDAVDAVGFDGAAVAILTDNASARDLLTATDDAAARIDELQFTIGQGPCLDAFRSGTPVVVTDLSECEASWPAFASEVLTELGVRTLVACPITANGAAFGVLELYRRAPGPFTATQKHEATSRATALGSTVLTELETYTGSFEESANPVPQGSYQLARKNVNIAIGMLAVRLHVPAGDAAAILRSHAYTHSRSISSIAYDVVYQGAAFELDD